jgi:hypothetical protein
MIKALKKIKQDDKSNEKHTQEFDINQFKRFIFIARLLLESNKKEETLKRILKTKYETYF